MSEAYSVYLECENCGWRGLVSIPRGEFVENFTAHYECENCGCKGTLGRAPRIDEPPSAPVPVNPHYPVVMWYGPAPVSVPPPDGEWFKITCSNQDSSTKKSRTCCGCHSHDSEDTET